MRTDGGGKKAVETREASPLVTVTTVPRNYPDGLSASAMEDIRSFVLVSLEERNRKGEWTLLSSPPPDQLSPKSGYMQWIETCSTRRLLSSPTVWIAPSDKGLDKLSTSDEPLTSADHRHRFCLFDIPQYHPLAQHSTRTQHLPVAFTPARRCLKPLKLCNGREGSCCMMASAGDRERIKRRHLHRGKRIGLSRDLQSAMRREIEVYYCRVLDEGNMEI